MKTNNDIIKKHMTRFKRYFNLSSLEKMEFLNILMDYARKDTANYIFKELDKILEFNTNSDIVLEKVIRNYNIFKKKTKSG